MAGPGDLLSKFRRLGKGWVEKPSARVISAGEIVPKNVWWVVGLGIGGIFLIIHRRKHGTLCCRGDYRAFLQRFVIQSPGSPSSGSSRALKDLNFAVKDAFDVEWYVTGFGSPEWARTHDPATRNAVAVSVLVQAGATCVGKTIMDEMGFCMDGLTNEEYGIPVNPLSSSFMVGGSCSGSAVAVAGDLVDFALGIDTAGDVRLPAACCGVLGFRATHGAVSTVGVLPVSQSLDAVGWFAKDPYVLRQVGLVLLQFPLREELRVPRRIYIANDCFKNSTVLIEHSLDVLLRATVKVFGRQVLHHINLGEYLTEKLPTLKAFSNVEQRVADTEGAEAFSVIRDCMLMVLRDEFLRNHHDWLDKVKPKLGRGIQGRVKATYSLTSSPHLVPTAKRVREEVRAAMSELLKHETLLVLPTVPGLPPALNADDRKRERFQSDTSLLMSIGSMSGGPQVSIPTGDVDGVPISISILGRFSGDRLVFDTVQALHPAIAEDLKISREMRI